MVITGYDGRISVKKLQKTYSGKYESSTALSYKAHHKKGDNYKGATLFQVNDCGFLNRNIMNKNVLFTAGGDGSLTTWDIVDKVKIKEISTNGPSKYSFCFFSFQTI